MMCCFASYHMSSTMTHLMCAVWCVIIMSCAISEKGAYTAWRFVCEGEDLVWMRWRNRMNRSYKSIHVCLTIRTAMRVLRLCNTLQHAAIHCNTLQHTVTHCNAPDHVCVMCTGACLERLQHNAPQSLSSIPRQTVPQRKR